MVGLAKFALAAGGCFVLAGPALAQAGPSYRAVDIEKHFLPEKDLGVPRALCIGAESQCSNVAPAAPKTTSGFDLLVNFEYNSDRLTPTAKANLDEFARAMRGARLARASFTVEGHTDGKGGEKFNLNLSARRAEAVVRYLEAHGVTADRLEAKAFGKSRPRTSDPADPLNRRVEARLRAM